MLEYAIVLETLLRGVALCNITHFLSFYWQISGLVGSKDGLYYFHFLPKWVHKSSTLISLIIELPMTVIWVLFPHYWGFRLAAFIGYVGLMVMINITGNYGHLGLMTVVISLALLDDDMVISLYGEIPELHTPTKQCNDYFLIGAFSILCLYTLASVVPLVEAAKSRFKVPILTKIYHFLYSFSLLNPYGMFAALHDDRWELIIEGSDDGDVWKRYIFYYKVSDPKSAPPIVWPVGLWPRLDWNLWFIPLAIQKGNLIPPPWFTKLLEAILKGNKKVLYLIKKNPFEQKPPKYLRVALYSYSFDNSTKSKNWWTEKLLGYYGAELKFDLENIWTFGIDAGKNIPQIKSSNSYKLSM